MKTLKLKNWITCFVKLSIISLLSQGCSNNIGIIPIDPYARSISLSEFYKIIENTYKKDKQDLSVAELNALCTAYSRTLRHKLFYECINVALKRSKKESELPNALYIMDGQEILATDAISAILKKRLEYSFISGNIENMNSDLVLYYSEIMSVTDDMERYYSFGGKYAMM